MKRLSIFLLALAFAVTFAVPAMAVHEGSLDTGPPPPGMEEGWAMYGDYTIDGEIYDQGASESKWYDDEFQFVIKVDRGPVTATVDFEISDDEFFEGSTINPGSNASYVLDETISGVDHNADGDTADKITVNTYDHLLDNYFIEYDAGARVEGLGVKIGEYGNSFGRKVAIYSEGGHPGFSGGHLQRREVRVAGRGRGPGTGPERRPSGHRLIAARGFSQDLSGGSVGAGPEGSYSREAVCQRRTQRG